MKNHQIFFYLIYSFFASIKSIDVKLSLGRELQNSTNTFPLIMTLKDPLISEITPLDIFCVIEITSLMKNDKINFVKNALYKMIDSLYPTDRLSLITFNNEAKTLTELFYMTDEEKKRQKSLIEKIETRTDWKYYKNAFNEVLSGIKKNYYSDSGRLQSVILITDGRRHYDSPRNLKQLFIEVYGDDKKYDFTLHTFLLINEDIIKELIELSDYRDGSFYYVKNLGRIKEYLLNIIGGLRSTAYKNIQVKITSPYSISKFHQSNKISEIQFIPNTNELSFKILQ